MSSSSHDSIFLSCFPSSIYFLIHGLGSRLKEKYEDKMASLWHEPSAYDYVDNRKNVACAPEHTEWSQVGEQGPDFKDVEIRFYEHRYQEGYHLHHDEQCSEWVQIFYPENNKGSKPGEQDLDFVNAEINLYKHKHQEDYDLYHDEQYNEWTWKFIFLE